MCRMQLRWVVEIDFVNVPDWRIFGYLHHVETFDLDVGQEPEVIDG